MTQNELTLDYMERFGSITRFDAFNDLGITELNTRIHELRKEGYEISGVSETAINRFGKKVHYMRYTLCD